jgi:hypothetical protein
MKMNLQKHNIIERRNFTGIKDVDFEIMSRMDDKSLINFCQVKNKYINNLCNNEVFWKKRTSSEIDIHTKKENRTWKEFYLKIVYYRNKFHPFEIVNILSNVDDYDLFIHFEKLAKEKIKEIMLTEMRMDYGNQVSQSKIEKIILKNKNNIEDAVNDLYNRHSVLELRRFAMKRNKEDWHSHEVNSYRDILFRYLPEIDFFLL